MAIPLPETTSYQLRLSNEGSTLAFQLAYFGSDFLDTLFPVEQCEKGEAGVKTSGSSTVSECPGFPQAMLTSSYRTELTEALFGIHLR